MAKKQKIYEASMELLIGKGYNNTSIRDIVLKSNISIGTFYNYFTNKEQLFLEIYEDFARMVFKMNHKATELYSEIPMVYIARSISMGLLTYQKYKKEAFMLRVKELGSNKLFGDKVRQFTERSYKSVEKMLEIFRDNNNLKIEDIKNNAICYVSSINGIILHMLSNEREENTLELAIPLISYNLNALGIDFDKKEIEKIYNQLYKEFNSGVFFD